LGEKYNKAKGIKQNRYRQTVPDTLQDFWGLMWNKYLTESRTTDYEFLHFLSVFHKILSITPWQENTLLAASPYHRDHLHLEPTEASKCFAFAVLWKILQTCTSTGEGKFAAQGSLKL